MEEDDLGADTRCFVVKPDSYRDIEQSHEERLLYPPGYILDRIRGACRGGPVALVFSVNGSRAFQGYATVDPKEVERNSSAVRNRRFYQVHYLCVDLFLHYSTAVSPRRVAACDLAVTQFDW